MRCRPGFALAELLQRVVQAGDDLVAEREIKLARSGDIDCADLAGPGVDVLEDLAMDGLEMGQIKFARLGTILQLGQTPSGHVHFKCGKAMEIPDVSKVLKDVRSGVNVRVRIRCRRIGQWPPPSVPVSIHRQRSAER